MPSLPRTQPERLWTKPFPSPGRILYATREGAGANATQGRAFLHENMLWLTPGAHGANPFGEWPALLGLDLATGEERVRVPAPAGMMEAHAAAAGDFLALAVRKPEPELSMIDRRTGEVAARLPLPLETGDRLGVTNLGVVWDSGTLLVSWCEIVRIDEHTSRGLFRTAAFRNGRMRWRNSNASLTGAHAGVVLTHEWQQDDFRERALSGEDGAVLWSREGRQPYGIFAGALLSKHLSPSGSERFPRYTLASADLRTGRDRWTFERENIPRFAWGQRHLAAGVDDGQPLVVLDDRGSVVLEDRTWANPGRGDARAVAAVDDASVLWAGTDASGRGATCCSPLMDPRARMWSIAEGLFMERVVFFDGGFVSLRSDGVAMYLAKGADA